VSPLDESLDLLTELESTGSVEPIVLYINAYTLEGGAVDGHTFFEVSLIRCEGSTKQGSNISNNLGFERFSTLSSVGGSTLSSPADIKSHLDKVRVAVNNALRVANDISTVCDDIR